MTYLPRPGYFGDCNTISGSICSGANVLLGRQQWSIDGCGIYFTAKNLLDWHGFYRNLMSITSLVAGA